MAQIGVNMKLVKAHITEFQSIHDSTEFEIGDVTCLVGKNEAGKTALLKALYRLSPVIDSDGKFDVTDDYPRQAVSDYEDAVEAGSEQAQVVHATYAFGADDITAVQEIYGPKCLKDENPTLVLHKGYSNDISFTELNVNSEAAIEHLIKTAGLPQPLADQVVGLSSVKEMVDLLWVRLFFVDGFFAYSWAFLLADDHFSVRFARGQRPGQRPPASFGRPARPDHGARTLRSSPPPPWTFARRFDTVPWEGRCLCDGRSSDDEVLGTYLLGRVGCHQRSRSHGPTLPPSR